MPNEQKEAGTGFSRNQAARHAFPSAPNYHPTA
jgi:hypothetical protein